MEEEDKRELERLEREFKTIKPPDDLPPPRDPTKLPNDSDSDNSEAESVLQEVVLTKADLHADL